MAHTSSSGTPDPGPDVISPASGGPASWLAHRADPTVPGSGPGDDDWVRAAADASLLSSSSSSSSDQPRSQSASHPLRLLVLYGTLRPAGFSKLLAHEVARVADVLGADVRTYNPRGLPVRDPDLENHPKVRELRELVLWSEAHVWVGAELHGNLCSVLKNQLDWIPVGSGTARWPTEGKTVAVYQVNGAAQSFNTVNTLRTVARWLRMPCTVTQGCVPAAWKEFDGNGRIKESGLRDRVVNVCEELYKSALTNRDAIDGILDRYSVRKALAEVQPERTPE